MRIVRRAVLGAAALALLLLGAACGGQPGGGGNGDGRTVASTLILGGPPECPERPFCIPGLRETYGIEFADFVPLDVGGPLTVQALEADEIDVALLFSTSSVIGEKNWVVLEDDENLQNAENITPVVRREAAQPALTERLNAVSRALTTEEITALNARVEVSGDDPADVAAEFLAREGLLDGPTGSGAVTVGAVSFAENQIVAEMYAQTLEAAGYDVERQLALESREIVQPALAAGDIDVAPEYLSSLLLFVQADAEASGVPGAVRQKLEPILAERGLLLLESSKANDTNAFVVTRATAEEYGLERMSDLAKPLP